MFPLFIDNHKATRIFSAGFLLASLFVCLFSTSCSLQDSGNNDGIMFDGNHAYELAEEQVQFGDRSPGSEGSEQISSWIEAQLGEYGWAVEEQVFQYEDTEITNLIAKRASDKNEPPIILGAHFDTRPNADRDTAEPYEPVPGANDGASGVAVLLELSKVLSEADLEVPVWLVFFDAEDSGGIDGWEWSVGSAHFAQKLNVRPLSVVIIDMVGDENLEIYMERNSDELLSQEIWDIASELGYEGFIHEYKYAMIDDHLPFRQQEIPAILIIDFDYPFWHTTQDTIDKISAASLEQVGRTIQTWILSYASTE
jgi:hypothetical protein